MRVFKLILLVCILTTNAQNPKKNHDIELGNYIFTSAFQTDSISNFNGKNLQKEIIIHKVGNKINVLKIIDNSLVIQYYESKSYLNITKKEKELSFNKTYYREANSLKYFKIKIDDFLKIASRYLSLYKGASAGFYSVPFKLRFNNFDFEQELNLGLSIGLQYRLSRKLNDRWIIEPNFGIGLAKINLNSKNSNVSEARTASAFSISSGLILHFSKTINLGCFVGWDFLSNEDANINWVHNGKPWLGIGINIGFNISKSKDSKQTNAGK